MNASKLILTKELLGTKMLVHGKAVIDGEEMECTIEYEDLERDRLALEAAEDKIISMYCRTVPRRFRPDPFYERNYA